MIKEAAILNILSLSGKRIAVENMMKRTSSAILNMRSLIPGAYVLQYVNAEGENQSVKFVKR